MPIGVTMSSNGIDDLIKKANGKKKTNLWLEAAQLLEKAVAESSVDVEQAEFLESAGYCYGRASQQATNPATFEDMRRAAVRAYTQASKLYRRVEAPNRIARSNECSMMAECSAAWLSRDAAEKKKTLINSIDFGKKSADLYVQAGDNLAYGRVCTSILNCLFEMLYLASDSKELAKTADEGIEYADQAIKELTMPEGKELLLKAYSLASLQSWYAANISDERDKSEQLAKRSVSFSNKAQQQLTAIDDPYSVAMSNWATAFATLFFTEKVQLALEYAKKMNEQAKAAEDNYLIGVSNYVLAQVSNWIAIRETDLNKQKEWYNTVIEYAQNAAKCLQPLYQDFYMAQVRHFNAESLALLARGTGVDPKNKRALLERAVEMGREGVRDATHSGSPDAMGVTLHALSKTLQFYSNFETDRKAKTALLEEALIHRQGFNEIVQKTFPSNDWLFGVGMSYAGLIRKDLAELQTDLRNKKTCLEGAIADLQEAISRCRRTIIQRPIPTRVMTIGGFEEGLSNAFCQLFKLTNKGALLAKAIEVDRNAADDFRKSEAPNRAAECFWRIAVNQNCLGDHTRASEAFTSAYREYESASKQMPAFSAFYMDYAAYMRGWSEIEVASFAHEQERYHDAERHFKIVSSIFENSKLWSYFAPSFLALSLVERGEDLSRTEKTRESLEAFREAAELFRKARQVFEKTVDQITSSDEKKKAIELTKACLRRIDYCSAREQIEGAKIDDRNGKHADAADKYDSAASFLEKMIKSAETENERKEIVPLACMIRAWQRMKMADARASAELYSQASDLFSEAKKQGLEDRQVLLASGNSAVCKALEHGTLFEETNEKTEFSQAKRYLETASNLYLKAGLESASTWTTATESLLDAYNYLMDAEIESDVGNKSKMLMLAEKCLEQSAKLYETANHLGRRREVLRIIAKVRQKSQFALSLGELLTTPGEASTTRAIPAPGPTVEEPVGLQKFERELIQANLVTSKREILAAEDSYVDLHVANLGKTPAFLTRVDDMLPEGVGSIGENEAYTLEGHHLNMKGKILDPSRSETFRIEIRSLWKGSYKIKPRIICVDETGRQVFCDPEPLSIGVMETTLPNRIATGYRSLDLLLLGGIPEKLAVLLTSPSFDERASLIGSFLESGIRKGEITFHVAVDVRKRDNLADQFPETFYLFICNPRADEIIEDRPNVFKLKGVENLTDISIALTSAIRSLKTSATVPRRLCLELISDVLLHHHAPSTRRWLTALLPELRAHRFTTLALLNPQMHPSQDVQAILDVFDGEISIYERDIGKGSQRVLAVRRLSNEEHLNSVLPI